MFQTYEPRMGIFKVIIVTDYIIYEKIFYNIVIDCSAFRMPQTFGGWAI